MSERTCHYDGCDRLGRTRGHVSRDFCCTRHYAAERRQAGPQPAKPRRARKRRAVQPATSNSVNLTRLEPGQVYRFHILKSDLMPNSNGHPYLVPTDERYIILGALDRFVVTPSGEAIDIINESTRGRHTILVDRVVKVRKKAGATIVPRAERLRARKEGGETET